MPAILSPEEAELAEQQARGVRRPARRVEPSPEREVGREDIPEEEEPIVVPEMETLPETFVEFPARVRREPDIREPYISLPPAEVEPTVVVVGAAPVEGLVALKDTETGEMWYAPGTPEQITGVGEAIRRGEEYSPPYIPPEGVTAEKPIAGSVVGTRTAEAPVKVYDYRGLPIELEQEQYESMFAEGKFSIERAVELKVLLPGTVAVKEGYISGWRVAEKERFKTTHTKLPGLDAEGKEQWIDTTELNRLKIESPDLYKVLTEQGFSAYKDYLETNYASLPNEQWMSKDIANAVREQSEYGYNVLVKQGIDAYNKAIEDALKELESYKRTSGYPLTVSYRLNSAVAAGVSKDTLSLLFSKGDVDKAWTTIFIPELAPEVEAKPTSGLPIELVAALPVAGVIAVAEPTFIGEAIVGVVILGAAAYAVAQGKDLNWSALWSDITSAFKQETGREPTEAEVAELETAAANTIRASAIPVVDMPATVAMKAVEPILLEEKLVPPEMEMPMEQIIAPAVLPLKEELAPPRIEVLGEQIVAPLVTPLEEQIITPEVHLPQLIIAQATAVKETEEEIATIIKPKVMSSRELQTLWDAPTVSKTEAGLIALDEAVNEAAQTGEIDETTILAYHAARDRFLAAKLALENASKAYIGGMQPQLASNIQNLAALAFLIALGNLQRQANKVATEAYAQALAQGMTQAQAITAAQTAALNAIRAASQVATQSAVQAVTQAQAITNTTTITAVQTAVNTAVNTATTIMTQTAIATLPKPPKPPKPPSGKELAKKPPRGTITWRQGIFWIIMPPPYNKRHYSKSAPAGAYRFAVGEDSAYKTIQAIGGMPSRDVRGIDIGIAIVDIIRKDKELKIEFKRDVADVYKGKSITEKIKAPRALGITNDIPSYAKDEDGRIYLTEKSKKTARIQKASELIESKPKRRIAKVPDYVTIGDRYYLGHRLRPAELRANL